MMNPHFEHTHTMSGNTQVYVPPMSGTAQVYVSPPVQPHLLSTSTNPYASQVAALAVAALTVAALAAKTSAAALTVAATCDRSGESGAQMTQV